MTERDAAKFKQRNRGISVSSYALLVGLVSVVAISAVTETGGKVDTLFGSVTDNLASLQSPSPDVEAPSFTTVTASGGPYDVGEVITFTLSGDENLAASGSPSLTLDIGGQSRTASFSSVSAGDVLFTYTVQSGDSDVDGVEVTAINAAAGELTDEAGNDLDVSGFSPMSVSVDVCAGSQTYGPGSHTLLMSSLISACSSFEITVIGAAGYDGTTAIGGLGGQASFTYTPLTVADMDIFVGQKSGQNNASAVKHGSEVIAISGGGGKGSLGIDPARGGGNGGDGGGGNNAGGAGSFGPSASGGGNNIGGAGNSGTNIASGSGGSAGSNGGNCGDGQAGGVGDSSFLISGGGCGRWGGYGGAGYGGGGGAGYNGNYGNGGGGGGYLNLSPSNGAVSNIVVPGASNTGDGSVVITWSP